MFSGGIRKEYWSEMFSLFPSQCFLLIPRKHQTTKGFLTFPGELKREHWEGKGVFLVSLLLTYFIPCSSVSVVNFEHVIAG